jgi:hypothetical protein
VIGGSTGAATASCELYDPSTGTWSNVASMNVTRFQNGATTLLQDGKVLVTGGTQSRFHRFSGTVRPHRKYLDPHRKYEDPALRSHGHAPHGRHRSALPGGEGQSISCGKACTSYVPTANAKVYNQASFAPNPGIRKGAVTLKDNEPGSPTQTITLAGTGATSAMTLVPAGISFPGQTPGTSSSPMSTMLYKDGVSPVSITSFAISPAHGTFTQTNNCPWTLNPNTSYVIQVVCTPPDTGRFKATLSVNRHRQKQPTDGLPFWCRSEQVTPDDRFGGDVAPRADGCLLASGYRRLQVVARNALVEIPGALSPALQIGDTH